MPTVVFVAPPGAWAGSAGCFITMAADVAAMAPATSIGAAHPVGIGAGSEKQDEAMKQKLENFASSYIEAIAAKRHRNIEWARASVRESASITADKALELNVIDLIAADLPDLLKQLDGREVGGRRLETAGASILVIPMTAREKAFQAIAHPQVMLILMLVAVYGIIGELTSPGAILPGVAGVIALLLLLYLVLGPADEHRRAGPDRPWRSCCSSSMCSRRPTAYSPPAASSRSSWAPHALRPQRALPAAVAGVDAAGHGGDGRCSSSSWSGRASAPSGSRRSRGRDDDRPDRHRPGADRRRGRPGVHRGRVLECRERGSHRGRPGRRDRRPGRFDPDGETHGRLPKEDSHERARAVPGPLVAVLLVLGSIILPQAARILREYERGVIFRWGKLKGAKGPGLIFLIPFIDRMVRMDLRVVTIDVPKQEVMTRDNVPATVDAVVYFRVVDPSRRWSRWRTSSRPPP